MMKNNFNKGNSPCPNGHPPHGGGQGFHYLSISKSNHIEVTHGRGQRFYPPSMRGEARNEQGGIDFKAFTLIEVIVSITIFSIIMISIIAIYILSSDTSAKSDINRAMHENLKSVITEIGEDIIKNGISGVSLLPSLDSCNFDSTNNYKKGTKLCLKSGNEYYLAKKSSSGNGVTYSRVENSSCSDIQDQCYLIKKSGENIAPLTNSLVSIKNLEFLVSSQYINKVTIKITLQPTSKAGVKPNLIAESKLIFQTTISERPF